jgi:hypothetical protein
MPCRRFLPRNKRLNATKRSTSKLTGVCIWTPLTKRGRRLQSAASEIID